MKSRYPILQEFTQAEITAGKANNLPSGTIVLNTTTGDVSQGNPSGAPNLVSTSGNSPLNNFVATTSPTANDDSGDGYSIGSRWVNTATTESYICLSATQGSAVWELSTAEVIADIAGLQAALDAKQNASTAATDAELSAHTGNTSNPHTVTKAQVGLGSVDNTQDSAKPVSTAQQTALDAKASVSHAHAQSDVTNLVTALDTKQETSPLLREAMYWYSADAYDFTTHTGQNLGAGATPITGLSGLEPIIASINGRPAWGLYVSPTASNGLRAANAMTSNAAVEVFLVKKIINTAVADNTFNVNGTSSAARVSAHAQWVDGNIYWDAGNGGADGRLQVAGGMANNDVVVLGFTAGGGSQTIRKNGSQLASDTTVAAMAFTGGLSVGYGVLGTVDYTNGNIAEILVFNRVLTANERAMAEGYLAKKYGGTLVAGHLFA